MRIKLFNIKKNILIKSLKLIAISNFKFVNSKSIKNSTKLKNDKFSLAYFILKSNTLNMYREILKYTSKISDVQSKNEIRNFIKEEFKRDSYVDYNNDTAKYKLGVARKKINELKEQIDRTL